MAVVICVDCGRELDHRDLQDSWQRVMGWEHRRSQGGTNALALREPLQIFMCATCMIARKHGTAHQEKLL